LKHETVQRSRNEATQCTVLSSYVENLPSWYTVSVGKSILAQLVKELPDFMEPKNEQEPATGPYVQPVESLPHFHVMFV